uniref:EGF-like domain-containing protein n=1 Tax=Setaria digitata TaxID=48799 RepID=A0A915PXI3_9BILA
MILRSCYCLLLTAVFSANLAVASSKGELRHLATNKNFIGRLPEGQFEVVHPFQIRDKNDRIGIDTRNHYLNGSVHYKQVTIVIRSTVVNRLKLLLGLNELLFINGTDFRRLDNNGNIPVNRHIENCYYQGTVNGEETSFVALSTCNGLRGIIAFENGSAYGIWPLDGGDRGRRHPHVLYRTKWSQPASCGSQVGESLKQLQKMKKHDLREEEGIAFILEAINIADYMFSRDLNVRLTVVYLEEWMDKSRIDYHEDIERTLSSAVEYVTGHIYHIAKDSSLMFTSSKFVRDEVMTSTSGSICSSRATGLVVAVDTYTAHETGQLIAHNLAHTMGLDHDSLDCACDFINCIMHKQAGNVGTPFLWQFSKCSVARMHSVLQSGHLYCLLNKPLQASTLQQCGNGIIDGEEECDCGLREQCLDPCCDPVTCTLRAHAHCASHQSCCHRCQLRPVGHVCRPARSVCDVAETCTGDDGNCPDDGYLIDGTVCGISGQCWKGNCSDIERQCRDLWGSDAATADEHCYKRNGLGLEYGNCGLDRDGTYRKCEVENVHCGTLHCRAGSQTPVDLNLNSFNLQFLHETKQIQCKMVTNFDVGMVMDGSSCGSGKVCVQGICSPLVQVSPPVHCPSNNLAYQCSGHGDCTTARRCVCYSGWMGTACDTKTNITYSTTTSSSSDVSHFSDIFIPSFTGGHTLNTTTLIVILLIVGILLLLLLICLLFCYRRQSELEFSSPADEKLNDSLPENTQRSIKFGNMPSYREEKRKRKKDKHVYDALQRITEASDERDSASVKSRESGNNGHENNSSLIVNRSCIEYDPREDIVTTMLNGTATTLLKREAPSSHNCYCDGVLYHETCSEIMNSPPAIRCSSVALPARCERNRSGYATDSEIVSRYGARYVEGVSGASVELSPTSSQASVNNRMTPTPLKLNNIGMLLRQLQYNDEVSSDAELSAVEADHVEHADLGSNTESTRGGCESHETNTSLPNGLDPNLSRSIQNKDRNIGDERLDNSSRNCNNTSTCLSNEAVLNEQGALFQDCHSLSEIEMNERTVRHIHPHGQSQHSLFSDSFRGITIKISASSAVKNPENDPEVPGEENLLQHEDLYFHIDLASEARDRAAPRDINDPEHPLTLEQLNVVQEELIVVDSSDDETIVDVKYVPTIPHCSMATLIGLAIRTKLQRSLHPSVKVIVKIAPDTHMSADAINKQLADKERVAAALENPDLLRAPGLITLWFARRFSKGKRSKSTVKYLQKQWSDEFSRKAREHSYRARSAYKLLEINENLLYNTGMVVVDVGAAPGSWCQVVADIVQPNLHKDAFILGIDLQPIIPISGVNFLDLSDITAPETHQNIKRLLKGRPVNVVISDMAPNPTGDGGIDHERILSLCSSVLELSVKKSVIPLVKNGTFLCKIWDGSRREEFTERLKQDFKKVYTVKPKASRDHSAEVYLLAMKKLL